MYGFHKKVGLSDNSMKASERKNKSPSEYYNPYFRRGHPTLLWLINKPKSGNAKKGKRRPDEGDGESDEDATPVDESVSQPFNQATLPTRALPPSEIGQLQRKDLALVRDQMATLQQRQKQISDAIARLRHEHNQLYQQAMMFQNMHNRHENSINAILNFLANVFRKSLEEQGGTQNVTELLASIIPNVQLPSQGQGSVVDLGDWVHQHVPPNPAKVGTPKRPPRLLPPVPNNQAAMRQPGAAQPAPYRDLANEHRPPGKVTELYDTPTPAASERASSSYFKQELESNPQEGMLKFIQDANSNAGKSGSALSELSNVAAHTASSMTNDQRDQMLSIMSGAQPNPVPVPTPSSPSPSATPPVTSSASQFGIPLAGAPPIARPSMSVSPVMPSAVPASIERMSQTEEELEKLQQLQREQSQKLEDLSALLGPLSPSGRIPGIGEQNDYFGEDIDISQYLEPNAYTADGTGNDFNFDAAFTDNSNLNWPAEVTDFAGGLPAVNHDPSRIMEENTPSHRSPSPSGTEEIPREDFEDSPTRALKRQRKT
ncbi:hypothetical protein F5Y17DRAFT_435559 [Xylariaceae sp. FL0594]|nr:hypothetical protein F5Y17DRAFT_435559 [Xylariaceae sp. FL0594]